LHFAFLNTDDTDPADYRGFLFCDFVMSFFAFVVKIIAFRKVKEYRILKKEY
jgi:hypothetical protein